MQVVLENLPFLLSGLAVTIQLALGGMVLALVLGTLVALVRVSPFGPLRALGTAYVEFLRNTPLLVHMFFWVFGLPFVGVVLPEFTGALLGLGFYTSAFVAEAVRAGILAVGRGQIEAGRSLGLTYGQVTRHIILPQAFATTVPPLGNLGIALTKNTSVATAVFVPELMNQAEILNARTFATYPVFIATGLLYVALTLPLARLVGLLERRLTRFRSV